MFKVSLVQMDVKQQDIKFNISQAEKMIAIANKNKSQLICFPEMWTTGFDFEFNKRQAAKQDDTIAQISSLARQHHMWITGSLLYHDNNQAATNTCFVFDPNGNIAARYDKIHLFSYVNEDQYVSAGNHLELLQAPWGKTGLAVCYDIRFCELFRSYAIKEAILIIVPSAFPKERIEQWRTLLKARAIENQLFVIGINQVATEMLHSGDQIHYGGQSCIIDPWGQIITEADSKEETIIHANIDLQLSSDIRNKMQVFQDRRPDCYEL